MKKVFQILTFIFLFFISFTLNAEERNYTKIVKDKDSIPIMKITVQYVGKQPVGDFNSQHDWKKFDTDFYDLTRENLTDKPIEYISSKAYSKYPVEFTTERKLPEGKIEIIRTNDTTFTDFREKPVYSGNILKPHDISHSKNHYIYYSKKTYNVRYYDVTIKHDSDLYTFTYYFVYQK